MMTRTLKEMRKLGKMRKARHDTDLRAFLVKKAEAGGPLLTDKDATVSDSFSDCTLELT
jgi:hypothetical protein